MVCSTSVFWHGKSVKVALEERIARSEVQHQFGDILVPTEEVIEMKAGVKKLQSAVYIQVTSWCKWK